MIMCDKNQAIYNRIISPYVTGALKHSMQMTLFLVTMMQMT